MTRDAATIGVLAGHRVAGGYGDRVGSWVTARITGRGLRPVRIGPGRGTAARARGWVVTVGLERRWSPLLPVQPVVAGAIRGAPVAVVGYAARLRPGSATVEDVRAELAAAGASVVGPALVVDPRAPAGPFDDLALGVLLDGLVAGGRVAGGGAVSRRG